MNLGGTFVGALFALTIGVSNVTAQQQVITVCGASTGFGYYLEPTVPGAITSMIVAVSTRPNRQNRST
jgi:hypothetical protein